MNFGKRLQRAINELGISQAELGRRLGVKAQSVNGWCNSNILPRADILDQLRSATGYPLYWFFMDDEHLEDNPPLQQPKHNKPDNELEVKLLEQFELLPTNEDKERIIMMIELRLKELDDAATAYLQKRKIIPNAD